MSCTRDGTRKETVGVANIQCAAYTEQTIQALERLCKENKWLGPPGWALMFCCSFFFLQREISMVSRPIAAKLCHVIGNGCNFRNWFQNLGVLPPKNLEAENNFLAWFRTTSHFDHEYLRNGTRYRQLEDGVANYDLSCISWRNLVNFVPQTAKNRTVVLTHPLAIVQSKNGPYAVLCTTSSCVCCVQVWCDTAEKWFWLVGQQRWNSDTGSAQWSCYDCHYWVQRN